MDLKRLTACGLLFLATGGAGTAVGQGSTVYLSVPFHVGARAIGFSGASVGDNPDVSVMYGNPAALSFLGNSSILLTHTLERSSNVMEENIAAPLFLRKGEVVSIALTVGHVGRLSQTDKNDFNVIQYGYDVGYSRRIIPTLSVGGTLNVRYGRTTDSRLWGLSSSVGAFYFPSPEVSYGFAFTGIGSGIKYIFDGSKTLLNSQNLSPGLKGGSTWRYPSSKFKERYFILNLEAEKIFDQSGLRYYGGVEFLPVPFFSVRLGYLGAQDNVEYASYGAGINVGKWKLDFGFTPSRISNQMIQVTLTTNIWNQIDNVN